MVADGLVGEEVDAGVGGDASREGKAGEMNAEGAEGERQGTRRGRGGEGSCEARDLSREGRGGKAGLRRAPEDRRRKREEWIRNAEMVDRAESARWGVGVGVRGG